MSGTSGIQNYLSNVFRPVYTYDPTTTLFTPRLELSNIDTYSGNTVSVFTLAVGDSNSNVYVGSNAGNPYNITKNVFNVTALGYGAASNISNDCNSIYIGWYAGSGGVNSRDVISIGANSGGNGSNNIFVGTSTGTVGASNILLGHHLNPGNVSNKIQIGYSNHIPIAADLSTNWVGLGGFQGPVFTNEKLDISGSTYILGNVGINTEPGVNGTLDVNGDFNVDDGYGILRYRTDLSTSRVVLSNFSGGTAELDVSGCVSSSTMIASGGLWSLRNQTPSPAGSTITIGPLKIGLAMVSIQSAWNPTTEYAAGTFFILDPTFSAPVVSNVSYNHSTNTLISFGGMLGGSGINISNNGSLAQYYNYSITYFPLTPLT